jgi:starch synthase
MPNWEGFSAFGKNHKETLKDFPVYFTSAYFNPKTDTYIDNHFTFKSVTKGKFKNKEIICQQFGFDINLPLFVFIGRLVGEKAADILPNAIQAIMYSHYGKYSMMILGSGDPNVELQLTNLTPKYKGYYYADIGYNESLSHLMYAGADFLLMPSRVEPCGLNQMYSMRYGTVPIVRSTGGLQDTIKDMGEIDGFGIRFNHATVEDIHYSVSRGISVFEDKKHLEWMRKYMMQIDHSWEETVAKYDRIYN